MKKREGDVVGTIDAGRHILEGIGSFLCTALLCSSIAVADSPELVSQTSSGTLGNSASEQPSVSANGLVVSFESRSNNLLGGDFSDTKHIYVSDRSSGALDRGSVSSSGSIANSDSHSAQLSGNGRYVVFVSSASNLVDSDSNGADDVFRYDRDTKTTERVSAPLAGTEFDGASTDPDLSSDGRFVVFSSSASNVIEQDGNDASDVFVKDLETGQVELISVALDGQVGNRRSMLPRMSADGRYVVFVSDATNLVEKDSNGARDVFIRDRISGVTERVTLSSANKQLARNSTAPDVSDDGRFVVFETLSDEVVDQDRNGFRDLYLRDREERSTVLVSGTPFGDSGNGESWAGRISGNGQFIVFSSRANDLVEDDTNEVADVFAYDRVLGDVQRVSVSAIGKGGGYESLNPAVSAKGEAIVFESVDTFLQVITNKVANIFAVTFDRCEGDADKREPGVCGCGESDVDRNESGIADCLEPDASYIPRPPLVVVSGGVLRVSSFDTFSVPVEYRIVLNQKLKKRYKKFASFIGTGQLLERSDLAPGNWEVLYQVLIGTGSEQIETQFSPGIRFKIKDANTVSTKKRKKRKKRKNKVN